MQRNNIKEKETAMGMSASVARYLALTAAKSNTEYEGQQINEQRLALSNKLSEITSEQYGLSVPTTPMTSEFSRTVYRYTSNDGLTTFTIAPGGIIPRDTGNYDVTLAYENHGNNIEDEGQVRIHRDTSTEPYTYTVVSGNENLPIYSYASQVAQGAALESYDESIQESFHNMDPEEFPGTPGNIDMSSILVYYVSNSGSAVQSPRFLFKDRVEASAMYSPDDTTMVTSMVQVPNGEYTTYTTHTNVPVSFSPNGQVYSISLPSATGSLREYILSPETTFDEDAYNDALRKYDYDKAAYDKMMSDLNAKTKDYQQQDKRLELRLQMLDTKRNALNTELEAVKKVIQDSVDKGFKTFSG